MSEVTARETRATKPLSAKQLRAIDGWWRAANYLSVGQIYLRDNPLLQEPLNPGHVKPRLLGHWGTTPGVELHLRPSESPHCNRCCGFLVWGGCSSSRCAVGCAAHIGGHGRYVRHRDEGSEEIVL